MAKYATMELGGNGATWTRQTYFAKTTVWINLTIQMDSGEVNHAAVVSMLILNVFLFF